MAAVAPADAQDTPRAAYGLLERRTTITIVVTLQGLGAAAWWSTAGTTRDMSSMVQGLAQAGTAMPFTMGAPAFTGMWITMVVAMMFPAIAPIVLAHRMATRRRGEGAAPALAFASGYLAVWAVSGVLPLAGLIALSHVTHGRWIGPAGGAVFVLAGIYQFTRWKKTCLQACRTPLAFLAAHDSGAGPAAALRTGISHGLVCLRCCWPLMTVLFVVGLMNLAWMAAIATVFLAEKNWRRGTGLGQFAGIAVLGLGIATLAHPPLLSWVASGHHGTMMTG